MNGKRVLIVDRRTNDPSNEVAHLFATSGCRVTSVKTNQAALEELGRNSYDLIVDESSAPQPHGTELLAQVKTGEPAPAFVMITAEAGVEDAVKMMQQGADDFLLKPVTPAMVQTLAGGPARDASPSPPSGRVNGKQNIITQNRQMQQLLQMAKSIADSRASVFIQGDSGTGKELFARYIHQHGSEKDRPFVAINCAALPETLLESELFGHEKGAFTGATAQKKGKFEIANHGTLLLDEITEMDFKLQAKLLRVLQEREIDRIGGARPIPIDVRIIATTNKDIESLIDEGKFREDLHYRLNVISFHLPALADRKDDIPLLANHFVEKYCRIDRRSVKGLTEGALAALSHMPLRGNVRELENVIERAVLLCSGDYIDEDTLFLMSGRPRVEAPEVAFNPAVSLKEMEKNVILKALDHTNGNRTHAADLLGISVRTLRNKLNDYKKLVAAQ